MIYVMKCLKAQEHKKTVKIWIGDDRYVVNNPDKWNANELQFDLAEKIYDNIRSSNDDVARIAKNYGWKVENVQKVKDHVFYNTHMLDRHGPECAEYKRFDGNLNQALAWKKMENNLASAQDKTWLAHEFAECHHEQKFNSGYTEAHERVQSRFDGAPWQNNDQT